MKIFIFTNYIRVLISFSNYYYFIILLLYKMTTKVAVVTGGNRGLGFEIVKGLCQKFDGAVYLTSRSEERGQKAVQVLEDLGLRPFFHVLDVTSEESIEAFASFIKAQHRRIDILVNNAGVLDFDKSISSYEDAKKLLDTNFYSLLKLSKHLYPLLSKTARVINISSDWGLLSNIRKQIWLDTLIKDNLTIDEILHFVDDFLQAAKNGKNSFFSFAGHYGDYKVSKVALSALTFVHQKEFTKQGRDISVNCVHPGFVKTDMTKGMGDFTPERGARAPLYLALEAPQTLKGTFLWHDCHKVNWDD